jgi:hypothetical protein
LPAPDDDFDIFNIIDRVFYSNKNIAEEKMYENRTYVEYKENNSDKNLRL